MAKNIVNMEEQAFILDLDDTLYKEIDFVNSAFQHIDRLLVADYGFPAGKGRHILIDAMAYNKNPFDELNSALKKAGIEIPNAISWMVDEYRYHIPQIYLSDDAYEFVKTLDEMAVEMFIITDGRSVTQRNKIRALGLDEFIPPENIYISEEVGEGKETGAAFDMITRRMADKGKYLINYIFVGDNPAKDFLVANANLYSSVMLIDDGSNIHSQKIHVAKAYQPRYKVKKLTKIIDMLNRGDFELFN